MRFFIRKARPDYNDQTDAEHDAQPHRRVLQLMSDADERCVHNNSFAVRLFLPIDGLPNESFGNDSVRFQFFQGNEFKRRRVRRFQIDRRRRAAMIER